VIFLSRKWWKEGVVYQIYPRSFYDSNGDGIGGYNLILYEYKQLNYGLRFRINWKQRNYNPAYYDKHIVCIWNLRQEPVEILIDKEKYSEWEYNSEQEKLWVELTPEAAEVKINY